MVENRAGRNDTYFSIAQVAEHLNVSKMTIYRLIHTGQLPAVRIGQTCRVSEEAMTRYLEEGTARTGPSAAGQRPIGTQDRHSCRFRAPAGKARNPLSFLPIQIDSPVSAVAGGWRPRCIGVNGGGFSAPRSSYLPTASRDGAVRNQ
jgi:excisionase family DNA binding protein